MYQTVCLFFWPRPWFSGPAIILSPSTPKKTSVVFFFTSIMDSQPYPLRFTLEKTCFQKFYKFTLMTFLAMFLLDTPPWRFTMNWIHALVIGGCNWKKYAQVKLDQFLKGWGFKKKNLLWRIIPVSKWFGSPPFKFISHEKDTWKGNNMVINHLQVLGWSSK